MVSEDQNGGGTRFCISCGTEMPANTTYCPDCGSSQNPDELAEESEGTADHDGFTSWAYGFRPGETGRNVLVGLGYFLFYFVGVPLLIYAYLVEHPDKRKYFVYAGVVLLVLVGLGALSDGSIQGIAAGVLALALSALFLPVTRQKLGIEGLPGVDETNSDRRNVLTGVGYGFVSVLGVGVLAPETEAADTGTDSARNTATTGEDTSGDASDDTSGAGSSGGSLEERYPNAWVVDSGTGIVISHAEGNASEYSLTIEGEAINASGEDYEYVQLQFGVYDDADRKVGDGLANTSGLATGQHWRFEAFATDSGGGSSFTVEDITAY